MPNVGDRIDDKYELTRLIGEGGMGTVFEANHVRIRNKKVAIKFLHADIASDHEALERFKREAEAAAAVDHPGIIDVQDIGQLDDSSPFMVLEFLHGESLADALASSSRNGQRMPITVVVYVTCKVLSALSAAHQENVIHRDLKPDNIFLVDVGADRPDVRLLDFGIARFKGQTAEASTLTSTGAVIGTPFYLSPEQAQGHKDIDHRTDIYSMGAILYQCLTGERPFTGPNYPRLIVQLCTEQPPPFEDYVEGISEKLQAIVLKALQKNRSMRHQSAAELFKELAEFGNQVELNTVIPPRQPGGPTPAVEESPQTSTEAWVESAMLPLAAPTDPRLGVQNVALDQPSRGTKWPMIALVLASATALMIAIIAVSVAAYVLLRNDRSGGSVGVEVDETLTPANISGSDRDASGQPSKVDAIQDPEKSTSNDTGSENMPPGVKEAAGTQPASDGGPDASVSGSKAALSQAPSRGSDGRDTDQTESTKSPAKPTRPPRDQTYGSRRPTEQRPRQPESRPRPPQYGGRPSYGLEVTPTPTYGREIR